MTNLGQGWLRDGAVRSDSREASRIPKTFRRMDTQSRLHIRRTNSSLGCEVMNSVSLVRGNENSPDKDMDSGEVNKLGSWMQSLDPLR